MAGGATRTSGSGRRDASLLRQAQHLPGTATGELHIITPIRLDGLFSLFNIKDALKICVEDVPD